MKTLRTVVIVISTFFFFLPLSAQDKNGVLDNRPLNFEPNRGQTAPEVLFVARTPGYDVFLTQTEAVLRILGAAGKVSLLHMALVGAGPVTPLARGPLLGKTNYLRRGRDSITDIPNFSHIDYPNVLPGVSITYHGSYPQLEYDVVLQPRANPNQLAMRFRGAQRIRLDSAGALVIQGVSMSLRQPAPSAYQLISGKRRVIDARYVLLSDNRVGWTFGPYNHSRPLVIDPVLQYGTYLGGDWGIQNNVVVKASTDAAAIAVDSSGNIYVSGSTLAIDYPTTPNAYQPAAPVGCDSYAQSCFVFDVFVTKLNSHGALVYSTYLDNSPFYHSYADTAAALAIDGQGNAYVAINSTLVATDWCGSTGPYVEELNAAGSTVLFSTSFAGECKQDRSMFLTAIALDTQGNVYVTGSRSGDPGTPGAFQVCPPNGLLDGLCIGGGAFVAKLKPSGFGNPPAWLTYVAGSQGSQGNAIKVDASGNIYITGFTSSKDFPTTPGALRTALTGSQNAFISKIKPDGSGLIYSTYLGGSATDVGNGIALDNLGNAYVVGTTSSTNFPVKNAFRSTLGGGKDAFVTKLNATGTSLVYSTYLGGSGDDFGNAIGVDSSKRAYVTGSSGSLNFPITANAFQRSLRGPTDAFVTTLNATGNGIEFYSTFLGGGAGESGTTIALDRALNAYVAGHTNSTNFPVTSAAIIKTLQGSLSAFVAKIVIAADISISETASPSPVTHGANLTYTIKATNNGPDSPYNVKITDSIPAGTTFVRFSTTTTTCTAPLPGGTGTLSCTRAAALPKGGVITVILVVHVSSAAGSTITNTAKVSAGMQDLKLTNNTVALKTAVQ